MTWSLPLEVVQALCSSELIYVCSAGEACTTPFYFDTCTRTPVSWFLLPAALALWLLLSNMLWLSPIFFLFFFLMFWFFSLTYFFWLCLLRFQKKNVITATDASGKYCWNSNLGLDPNVAPLLHLLMPTAILSVLLDITVAANRVDPTVLLLPETYLHLWYSANLVF